MFVVFIQLKTSSVLHSTNYNQLNKQHRDLLNFFSDVAFFACHHMTLPSYMKNLRKNRQCPKGIFSSKSRGWNAYKKFSNVFRLSAHANIQITTYIKKLNNEPKTESVHCSGGKSENWFANTLLSYIKFHSLR